MFLYFYNFLHNSMQYISHFASLTQSTRTTTGYFRGEIRRPAGPPGETRNVKRMPNGTLPRLHVVNSRSLDPLGLGKLGGSVSVTCDSKLERVRRSARSVSSWSRSGFPYSASTSFGFNFLKIQKTWHWVMVIVLVSVFSEFPRLWIVFFISSR